MPEYKTAAGTTTTREQCDERGPNAILEDALYVAEGGGGQQEWLLVDGAAGEETFLQAEVETVDEQGDLMPEQSPVSVARPKPLPLRRTPHVTDGLPLDTIFCGDSLDLIKRLPDQSVHLVVTSPPYFQQRNYGAGMGNEKELVDYLAGLLALFRECVRVTRDDGSIVFNLGDKYQESSLLLVPYRFAVAATETGLVKLVNAITWVKRNPTPRQFQRRLVSSAEPFFHFVKTNDYFYNLDAYLQTDKDDRKTNRATPQLGKKYVELIAQSKLTDAQKQMARVALAQVVEEVRCGQITGFRMKIRGLHSEPFGGQEGGRKIQLDKNGFTVIRIMGNKLKRDVIETPVESLKGCKHPAVYPTQIVEELLQLLSLPGDVVLDPFLGSGSTAVACKRLGRRYIGYELNPEYCDYARSRIAATPAVTTSPLERPSK